MNDQQLAFVGNDFDFLIGQWRVVNSRLRHWLCDSTDWFEFESVHTEKKLASGLGTFAMHEYLLEGSAFARSVLRQYSPSDQFWKICRMDAMSPVKFSELIGSFWAGKGRFLSKGIFKDQDVLVWVEWTKVCETFVCWEQALSGDNGKTWETNWVMEFYRVNE